MYIELHLWLVKIQSGRKIHLIREHGGTFEGDLFDCAGPI